MHLLSEEGQHYLNDAAGYHDDINGIHHAPSGVLCTQTPTSIPPPPPPIIRLPPPSLSRSLVLSIRYLLFEEEELDHLTYRSTGQAVLDSVGGGLTCSGAMSGARRCPQEGS